MADHCDLDSDNDGISDLVESGDAAGIALDANGDGTIDLTEGVDTDGDGLIDVFEDGDLAADIGTIRQLIPMAMGFKITLTSIVMTMAFRILSKPNQRTLTSR